MEKLNGGRKALLVRVASVRDSGCPSKDHCGHLGMHHDTGAMHASFCNTNAFRFLSSRVTFSLQKTLLWTVGKSLSFYSLLHRNERSLRNCLPKVKGTKINMDLSLLISLPPGYLQRICFVLHWSLASGTRPRSRALPC